MAGARGRTRSSPARRRWRKPYGKGRPGGVRGAVPDIRYTVPSGTASWWEWKGRRKCLAQKPDEQGLAVYRDILRKRFPSRKDAGVVRFDFSHVKDDVLWLYGLAP